MDVSKQTVIPPLARPYLGTDTRRVFGAWLFFGLTYFMLQCHRVNNHRLYARVHPSRVHCADKLQVHLLEHRTWLCLHVRRRVTTAFFPAKRIRYCYTAVYLICSI